MKTIRQKILLPMILLIVLVPLATLLFFNVAMRVYFKNTDRKELKSTVSVIETLSKQELGSGTITDEQLERLTEKISGIVESSSLSGARFLIFKGSSLVYPKTLHDGTISANLARQVVLRLRSSDITDTAEQIGVGKNSYLMTGYVYTSAAGIRVTVVLLSQEGFSPPLIKTINFILFIIMLVGIVLGVLIASRITGRMSKKIKEITASTDRIGNGDFEQQRWERTDIEEFSKLSLSITQMSKRLEASERSQRDFLQNASHELRTPLMSIQGYAEGIIGGIVPNVKEASEIIRSESRRLNSLVGELLTLSRIESRTLGKKLEELNLNQLLPEYVQRLGGIAVNMQKEVKLSLPENEIIVSGDEELLSQAISNVITNCLRYAKERVEISIVTADKSAVIRIADDGAGIPESDLPHIFERFYKGKGGNFGLGLAIAKSAVEYQGGEIKAYNGENGAVFEITLKAKNN